jgi:uracil phosphoribosyltransferase
MRIVVEDALAEFPVDDNVSIDTPCQQNLTVSRRIPIPSRICAISILRSGDCLLEMARSIEPGLPVGKILIQRNEILPDKPPVLYYHKFPVSMMGPNKATDYVLLCDPMIATAGSATVALDIITNEPYSILQQNIVFACIICAPEGLRALAVKYPNITIVTASVDQCLNEDKFIVPGLGDFGDRFFGTE